MTDYYLAILGPDGPERRLLVTLAEQADALQTLVNDDTKVVLAGPDQPHLMLPSRHGVILGRLFARERLSQPISRLIEEDEWGFRVNDARTLLDRYWGNYVGVLPDSAGKGDLLVRDPSGGIPCYLIRRGELLIATSDVERAARAGLFAATVDWGAVRRHLATGGVRNAATCLLGVREVLPGSLIRCRAKAIGEPEIWWNPWDYVGRPLTLPFDELASRLRNTLEACTAALAAPFERVLATVSGGLDSSVMSACLAKQAIPFECLTLATHSPHGDERSYARILAEALGVPLHERFYSGEDVDIHRSQSPGLPRPNGFLFDQSAQERQRICARDIGADAIFSGGGGDNVFCYTTSANPLIDRLEAEGLRPGAWRTLDDICELTGASMWKVAGFALRRRFLRPRQRPPHVDLEFLNGTVNDLLSGMHPWLSLPDDAPIGKGAHVASLVRAQSALEFTLGPGHPPTIRPWLSQPVMELCLSIPTWHWVAGGRDRAVARAAFANVLPEKLINRRVKGGATDFAIEMVESRRTAVLDLLRNGVLASNGVLNLAEIEAVLATRGPTAALKSVDIGRLVAAETWASGWTKARARSEPRQVA